MWQTNISWYTHLKRNDKWQNFGPVNSTSHDHVSNGKHRTTLCKIHLALGVGLYFYNTKNCIFLVITITVKPVLRGHVRKNNNLEFWNPPLLIGLFIWLHKWHIISDLRDEHRYFRWQAQWARDRSPGSKWINELLILWNLLAAPMFHIKFQLNLTSGSGEETAIFRFL